MLPAIGDDGSSDAAGLTAFGDEHGWPVIAKVARGGYDGRGVWKIERPQDAGLPFAGRADGVPVIAEEFVDFAGDTIDVIDPATGEARPAKLFVAAMGASSYIYAEARASEGLEDWIGAHVNLFAFLGASRFSST